MTVCQVFRSLRLSIPAGRTLAVCGESGSGKSTLIQARPGPCLLSQLQSKVGQLYSRLHPRPSQEQQLRKARTPGNNKGRRRRFSCCLQLVERFYDVSSGSVTLDGHDVRSLDLRWYRSNLGLVSQVNFVCRCRSRSPELQDLAVGARWARYYVITQRCLAFS